MNNLEFFSNNIKYKSYLIFHLFVSCVYFLLLLSILKTNSDKYFLFLTYLVINLFLSLVIYYKYKYCKILLNIFGIGMIILMTYGVVELMINYVNNIVDSLLFGLELILIGFLVFYLIYLNSKNKIEEIENIEQIGKNEI